ncbi:serine hydrolase domain-containing protein [Labilibacter marinus]|uniref:serine hydrolase domain-containing protein n=1 Tax=Labilibacter marinus TaxID=1477105 RepID=UPI0008354533|nr:serine hydrolase [Labilibacter marinus]
MTKYIYLLLFFSLCKLQAEIKDDYSLKDENIDTIYHQLSLEEKIRTILIQPTISAVQEDEVQNKWLDIEKLYKVEGQYTPMLSDMMIRSAFMRGDNEVLQQQFMNLLLRNKGDGVYFPMQSPYSLLFHGLNHKPVDFFLEPTGRLVIPYLNTDSIQDFFQTNLYKIPTNILSQHKGYKNEAPSYGAEYVKAADWKEVQDILKEYDKPSLEVLLSHGGLIYSDDFVNDYNTLLRVFTGGVLPEKILERSCKKRLLIDEFIQQKPSAKTYFSLREEVSHVVRNLQKKGAVLLQNDGIIPVNNLTKRNIATVHIGVKGASPFQQTLNNYCSLDNYSFEKIPDAERLAKIKKETAKYNTIIVAVNGDWFEDGVNQSLYSFLHQVSSTADLILVHFGSGNRLKSLPDGHPFKAILLSFETNPMAQSIAAQILLGGIGAKGVLPKKINQQFTFGSGEETFKTRLGFAPEYTYAMADTLSVIDKVVYKAIRERATPGCQVLVAKGGDVIYNKAFGYHTYNKKRHVNATDLYDIASVTKIVSSIPSMMKLYDEGRYELDDTLGSILPRLEGSNKGSLHINDVMIHQAGLQAWIPFYSRAIDKERLKGDVYNKRYSSQYNVKLDKYLYMNKTARYRTDIFRHTKSDDFNIRVCDDLYMNKSFVDSVQMGIDTSAVKEDPSYRYSDLGYYYMKEIIEDKTKQPLDNFVENTFYRPLGAERMLYKPLRKYTKKEIVPTEYDKAFRKELIHGYVHDPGAAMLGGVGGHAGVFASAEDLAKILQMYLNKGSYGGEEYIDSTVIKAFTSIVKEGNRRGLGFDKPVLDPDISGPCSKEASPSSYGHSGFTGTLVWMDPEYDLMYIFLSNRIHPNQYNKQLIRTDVRTKIQSAIYRSLPEYWEKQGKVNSIQ